MISKGHIVTRQTIVTKIAIIDNTANITWNIAGNTGVIMNMNINRITYKNLQQPFLLPYASRS